MRGYVGSTKLPTHYELFYDFFYHVAEDDWEQEIVQLWNGCEFKEGESRTFHTIIIFSEYTLIFGPLTYISEYTIKDTLTHALQEVMSIDYADFKPGEKYVFKLYYLVGIQAYIDGKWQWLEDSPRPDETGDYPDDAWKQAWTLTLIGAEDGSSNAQVTVSFDWSYSINIP